MASLSQMKAAAASQGASAPEDYPGGADAWVADWYQNAINAGSIQDPSTPRTRGEQTATDATTGSTPQGYKNTGTSAFADMIRKKAKDEGWSEDFERFSDAQIDAWQQYYDPSTGRFRSENDPSGAATYDKPSECPPGTTLHGSKCVSWDSLPFELGGTGGGGQAGGGGRGAPGGAAAPPPKPSTFGSQLSYTGNPLTDMLLYQFNTGTQLSDPSKMNMFNLGEDRQEDGTGKNADSQERSGQLLQGGGLWWSNDKEAFGGFRADTKNADPLAAAAGAAPAPQPSNGSGGGGGGSNQAATSGGGWSEKLPTGQLEAVPMDGGMQTTPMTNMLKGQGTWREAAGGKENPFEARNLAF